MAEPLTPYTDEEVPDPVAGLREGASLILSPDHDEAMRSVKVTESWGDMAFRDLQMMWRLWTPLRAALDEADARYRAALLSEPSLDAAWADLEALLPIVKDDTGGLMTWRIGLMRWCAFEGSPWLYRAVALRPEHGQPQAWSDGPTPAAALRALAARLSGDKP